MRRPLAPLCCLSAVLLGGARALQLQPQAAESAALAAAEVGRLSDRRTALGASVKRLQAELSKARTELGEGGYASVKRLQAELSKAKAEFGESGDELSKAREALAEAEAKAKAGGEAEAKAEAEPTAKTEAKEGSPAVVLAAAAAEVDRLEGLRTGLGKSVKRLQAELSKAKADFGESGEELSKAREALAEAEAKAKADGDAKARPEAEPKAEADARESQAKAKEDGEAKANAEAEEAQAQPKADGEASIKAAAEPKAKAETEKDSERVIGQPEGGAADAAEPWWKQEGQTKVLQIPPTWRGSHDRTGGRLSDTRPEKEVTAIVTHAGKSSQEFIDSAVMLAVSLKRHAPDYPRFAIAVRGMSEANQETLEKAGWTVILVDDWNELQHKGKAGAHVVQLQVEEALKPHVEEALKPHVEEALEPKHVEVSVQNNSELHGDRFFWRWADAFEKLNMFRLPFGRVLYLDADTYVLNEKLNFLLNSTEIPEGNIGMVHDGCHQKKTEDGMYNSGVMLFRPHRGMFAKLLKVVGGVMSGALEEKPDQPIINEVYKGRVTELDKKYNCIDRTGRTSTAECAQNCKEVVVTHFTGLPKPASADAKFLDIVRRPYSPILHCFNTNHGSCKVWSDYYCDVLENKQSLTKRLRQTVEATGSCCHTPRQDNDPPECRDGCPSQVKVEGWMPVPELRGAVFNKTNLFSHPIQNAGRPIFIGPNRTSGRMENGGLTYMFYLKPYGNWVIGWDYKQLWAWAYSHERASCPSDTKRWKDASTRRYTDTKSTAVADSPFTGEMVLDLENGSGQWVK